MLKRLLLIPFLLGFGGLAPPDPYVVVDPVIATNQFQFYGASINGSPRTVTINPAQKTLVLFVAGQSNWTNINPTLYTPSNSSAVSQFSIYDGAFYPIASDLLGSSYYPTSFGAGNVSVRVADAEVSDAFFNQVLIVNVAIGGTSVAQWSTTQYTNRLAVGMLRLAKLGITPATTGVTFGLIWGQGETDNAPLGTSQAAYTSSLSTVLTAWNNVCSSCRVFVCEETWISGAVSTNVQNAQIAAVNNTTIFSGGNLDSLNATNRQADNTHFNDSGAAAAALLVVNAMHASGSPF